MVLAAGRGERLRPLTYTVPKPLVEVGGETLIERHIGALAAAGVREIIINLSWLATNLVEHLGDGRRLGVSIYYSREGEVPLDTGGGIVRALPLLGDGPFWVVNADVYTDYDFSQAPEMGDALASLVLVPNPPHNPDGDFSLAGGLVGESDSERLTFAGIARYRPEFFAGQSVGIFSVVPLLREHASHGRVAGELYGGLWHDPGTPDRLERLRTLVAARRSV